MAGLTENRNKTLGYTANCIYCFTLEALFHGNVVVVVVPVIVTVVVTSVGSVVVDAVTGAPGNIVVVLNGLINATSIISVLYEIIKLMYDCTVVEVAVMEVVDVRVRVVVEPVKSVVVTTTEGEGVEVVSVTVIVVEDLTSGVEVTKMEVGSVVNAIIIGVGEKAKCGTLAVALVVATGIGIIVATVVRKTVLVIITELVVVVEDVTVVEAVVKSVTT